MDVPPAALPFRILVIADPVGCRIAGRTVVETVVAALPAADERVAFLVRNKEASASIVKTIASSLRAPVRARGAHLLVHTHADVADGCGLDGVHVADGIGAPTLAGRLVGASRHAGAALDEDDLAGFDYATLSPVFQPLSKLEDARPSLGLEAFATAAERSVRPLVALGGLTASRARGCIQHGASAVAVLALVMSARDPAVALSDLLDAVDAG